VEHNKVFIALVANSFGCYVTNCHTSCTHVKRRAVIILQIFVVAILIKSTLCTEDNTSPSSQHNTTRNILLAQPSSQLA